MELELALGENCIKIISDKPNSVGMFLGIQSDIYTKLKLNRKSSLKSLFRVRSLLVIESFCGQRYVKFLPKMED